MKPLMSEVSRTMRYLTLLLTRISTSTLPFQAYCKQKLHGIFQLICHLCTRLMLEIWFPHAATDFESTILLLQSQDPNCYRLTLSIIQWYSIEDSFHFLLCLKSHGGKAKYRNICQTYSCEKKELKYEHFVMARARGTRAVFCNM